MTTSPSLKTAVPILAALDIAKTVAFYTEELGFTRRHVAEGEYAILVRDEIELHFWACPERHIAENTACRIGVAGIEALHGELAGRKVIPAKGSLRKTAWGMQEFAIKDRDGNCITFFERITPRQG